MSSNLLTLPPKAGRAIVEAGAVIACPLLGTQNFVRFCTERGLRIDRERLIRLERLGFFAPVFRVRTPVKDAEPFRIPVRKGNNWFTKRWARDTTGLPPTYPVPDHRDDTQEGYYSIFQIDHLDIVLSGMNLTVQLDSYLDGGDEREINWTRNGERWLQWARQSGDDLRTHEYRRSKALLCQFISNRYYPHTQGDQRTIQVSGSGHYSDYWISVYDRDWNWHELARRWDAGTAARLFKLTPEKLLHAYEGLAIAQAHCDPLARWYQLTQFVSVRERAQLKGDALRAETLRAGAHMLRLLYKDLYEEELPHPNEVSGTVITPMPELEVRQDRRRYLEFVVNRYKLNPQPTVSVIVEGSTEEAAVRTIFEQYFGAHPGTYGIETIVLGGIDAATGTKEDRFRAILRLIDYLHHHQIVAFLILDNERYARKLKGEARRAVSIHHAGRHVTRPEYIKIWRTSFEFENFSCTEIAAALSALPANGARFSQAEIAACKRDDNPGAALKDLYRRKAGGKLDKLKLAARLVEQMLSPAARRKIGNRPIVKTLERVSHLGARNPFPVMQELWDRNQASKFLGKKRR